LGIVVKEYVRMGVFCGKTAHLIATSSRERERERKEGKEREGIPTFF
jgi:hypothetical protein